MGVAVKRALRLEVCIRDPDSGKLPDTPWSDGPSGHDMVALLPWLGCQVGTAVLHTSTETPAKQLKYRGLGSYRYHFEVYCQVSDTLAT